MTSSITPELIDSILDRRVFAVVGASRNRDKFGYQVYRSLKVAGYTVFPVNPNSETIDGDKAFRSISEISGRIDCVVTVVPPEVTAEIVRESGNLHISYMWMQPGSESDVAVSDALKYGMQVVHGGPCIMVEVASRAAS